MTTEAEVDRLIASWETRLARVDENLIALESEPTYQVLSGRGGQRAVVEGMTRDRVVPALDALAQLFEHRQRLTEVVDRARAIRAGVGFWDREQKLLEIRELLFGPSIKMTAVPTPLSRRNLLDPAPSEVGVVPEQLLFAMSNAFQVARDAVAEVSQAWSRLEPFLDGVASELAALKKSAEPPGDAHVAADLAWLDAELARVRRAVASDPLGVASGVDGALTPRLEQLRRRVADQSAARARVTQGLADALTFARRCEEAHEAARTAKARAAREIAGAGLPEPADDALVAGLPAWRDKIEATALAGRFGPADVGLARWSETARGYLAQDEAVASALAGLMEQRTELLGRLSARRAQEAALAARGGADAGLAALASTADALLRARPSDLARATRALAEYEAALVSLAERARRR